MKPQNNPHGGHRQRLRKRLREHGLESFEPHVALELLLTYAIPRRDTNELAHTLIRHFGDLRGVLEARVEELERVPGMGEHAASLLHMMPGLFALYAQTDPAIPKQIVSTEEARRFVLPRFVGATNEQLLVVFLGNKNQVLASEFLQEGSLASVSINTRQIVERAVHNRATGILLAHNHPQGFAIPSQEDIAATLRLRDVLGPMQVKLLDHIIVADGDCTSMKESELI